jgi:hypothetical protein
MGGLRRLGWSLGGHLRAIAQDLGPRHRVLAGNERLRDTHRGERCFILGSGKSILQHDLAPLASEIVITQNHFHVHEQIRMLAPRYHCVIPMYQPPAYASDWVTFFGSMQERLPESTHFFVGLNSKKLIDAERFFQGRVSFVRQGRDPIFLRRPAYDLTRNIMNIQTALVMCLEVALFLGFSRIYLLGFDLSQICEGREQDWGRFYGTSPITASRAERQIEDQNDRSGETWYHYWLMWMGFNLLRQEAERRGSEIVNVGRGGLLTCFERQLYEDVLNLPQP